MDRRVFIAGARPGGIGHATAEAFALTEGDNVLLCDRDRDAGFKVAQSIEAKGGQVHFVTADVSVPDEVEDVMDEAARLIGGIDVVVANAGDARTPTKDTLAELDIEELQDLFMQNVGTAFLVSKAAVRRFLIPQRDGVCILLGSLNGSLGVLGQLGYGIAKAGLVALCRVCCAQFGPYGIRFNVVQPGIIETDSPNWLKRKATDPQRAEKEGLMNPLGRVGEPEDVARVITFLANHATFVNGAVIPVDGGLSAAGLVPPGFEPGLDFRDRFVELVTAVAEFGIRRAA